MNVIKILFQLFLIIVFLAGIYVIITFDNLNKKTETLINNNRNDDENNQCHDLLIQKGNKILLYNTKQQTTDGINPISFNSLDDYKQFVEVQQSKNIHCPVLFLKREYDIQGKEIYRNKPIQPNIDINKPEHAINVALNNSNGLLFNPTNYTNYEPTKIPDFKENIDRKPIPVLDATRVSKVYNVNNYPSFDPYGLYVGKYTVIDKIHDSTQEAKISTNAMDTNWGGMRYSGNVKI